MKIETYSDSGLDDGVVGLFDDASAAAALNIRGWSVWIDGMNRLIAKHNDDVVILSESD